MKTAYPNQQTSLTVYHFGAGGVLIHPVLSAATLTVDGRTVACSVSGQTMTGVIPAATALGTRTLLWSWTQTIGGSSSTQTETESVSIVSPTNGASLSTHVFSDTDTDTGVVLNQDYPITIRQSEISHGIVWSSLPDDWSGATVTVSAIDRATGEAAPSELTDMTGAVDPSDGRKIRLDWPTGVTKPTGDWLLFARATLGSSSDVTSGVRVVISRDVV